MTLDPRLYQQKSILLQLEEFPNPIDQRISAHGERFYFTPIELIATTGRYLYPVQVRTDEMYTNNGLFLLGSLDLDSPYLRCIQITSPDQKRRISEDIGVGLGILFMQKSFALDWETIVQIVGSSTRADYQADNNSEEDFIFECKGTFDERTQSQQIRKGKNQKCQHIADIRLVLSTLISSNSTSGSLLKVVDPSIRKGFKIKNYELSLLRHYIRLSNYAGFLRLGRRLYFEYRAKLEGFLGDKENKKIFEVVKGKEIDENRFLENYKEFHAREIENHIYRGTLISKEKIISDLNTKLKKEWEINREIINYNFFFGLDYEVLNKLIRMDYESLKDKKIDIKSKIISTDEEIFVISSDGSVFGIISN